MHAATCMQGEGDIQAFDVHEGRLERVKEAADAHGVAEMVRTEVADLKAVADQPSPPQADRVLIDVPCTGLGVLSKRADLRWQREPDDLQELMALQDDLLDAAATLVRPGGVLVYSTCSIEPEENEERIEAFLDRQDNFAVESAEGRVPDEVVSPEGFLATLPHRHRVDGAFGARLRREDT